MRFAESGQRTPAAAPASPTAAAPPMIQTSCEPATNCSASAPLRIPDTSAPATAPTITPDTAATTAQRRSTRAKSLWVPQNSAALAPTEITTPANAPHSAAIGAVLHPPPPRDAYC